MNIRRALAAALTLLACIGLYFAFAHNAWLAEIKTMIIVIVGCYVMVHIIDSGKKKDD